MILSAERIGARAEARFPILVWAGAALLGWMASDPVIAPDLSAPTTLTLETISAIFGSPARSRLQVDMNLDLSSH
jgi:putative hemolysin